jgi:spermidine synthase
VLTASEGQIAVFQDDVLAFETQGTAAEEFVHPVALQLARVDSVLILGGGSSGLIAEALAYRPQRVESVEVDRSFHALVTGALPESTRARLRGDGVITVFADPRRYVRRAASRGAAYDLVLVGEPEPSSGRTNRLYTREFFAECAAILAERGVLALRLPSAENYWIAPLVRRTASIERALGAVFPSVLVLPGANTLLVASRAPLERDPEESLARWETRGLHPRLTTPAYMRYLYTNDRVASVAAQLAAAGVPANSDRHPVCYPYTLMVWLAKFHPALARLDPIAWASSPAAAVLAAVIGALVWWTVRRASSRQGAVVAAAGAAGMLLESVLLLAFQSRNGVLYEDLGLLLGLFMAGLTAGAWAVHARARRARPPHVCGRPAGTGIVAGLFLASLAIAVRLRVGALPGLAEAVAGLFLSGALTAAVFAHASLGLRDAARGAGTLYAADLAGGVLGCVIGSLLMIPVLGLPGTALAAAALAATAATWM